MTRPGILVGVNERAGCIQLGDERLTDIGRLPWKVSRKGIAGDVDAAGGIHRERIGPVVSRPSQVGGIEDFACGVELENESVVATLETVLEGIEHGQIFGFGFSGHQDVACWVYGHARCDV